LLLRDIKNDIKGLIWIFLGGPTAFHRLCIWPTLRAKHLDSTSYFC